MLLTKEEQQNVYTTTNTAVLSSEASASPVDTGADAIAARQPMT